MALTILPPEMTAATSSAAGGSKKPYDNNEFLPNKLESGGSEEIRLLGTYGSGHMIAPWRCAIETKQPDGSLKFGGYDFSLDYNNFPERARMTDWSSPDRKKLDNEWVKPKRAFCALIWSYERARLEVLIAEQAAIKTSIVEVLSDPDFSFEDDIATFVLRVSKTGSGLDTSYSVMPKPRKIEATIKAAFAEVKETAQMSKLLAGGHPLLSPTFSSDSSTDAEF